VHITVLKRSAEHAQMPALSSRRHLLLFMTTAGMLTARRVDIHTD